LFRKLSSVGKGRTVSSTYNTWRSVTLMSAIVLAGCGSIPNNGPIASEIVESSDNKGKTYGVAADYIFDVVDVDTNNALVAAQYQPRVLQQTFGIGGGAITPNIGPGDLLQITIFEAGPDGLFSTASNKSTTFSVTVQPDGNASIPYVGSIKFAGGSLESVRSKIASQLKSRAVEPDVIVSLVQNASRTASVNGTVGKASIVPLGLKPERVMEVLANAGGPQGAPYETYIALTRKGKTGKALVQTLVSDPSENIYVRPGDQFYVSVEPQTFSVLGSTGKSAKIPFAAEKVSLVEAAALAGGSDISLADPKGYFVFRYEYAGVLKSILGEQRFEELKQKGITSNGNGMFPMVYRIDMRKPENYIIGQTFQLRNKDVLYLSRHPSSDIIKFMSLLSSTLNVARGVSNF
jgi:polysaccharide export outer membrane protein